MFAWKPYAFTVGMPHMVPERLSEVELLMWLGAYQWESIADLVGVPSSAIVNEEGERLYASFIDIELSMGRRLGLHQLDEGCCVHLRNGTRVFARNFVEGLFLLDTRPLDDAQLPSIRSRSDLAQLDMAWVAMDNAFVARFGGENDRLKVFAPAGLGQRDLPETGERPPGISEHGRVQGSGAIAPAWDVTGFRPLPVRDASPVSYEIVAESDLNGAGLVYFARFVALMDYGERILLTERIEPPLSRHLVQFLTTAQRRIFFFANAQPSDRVAVRLEASLRAAMAATAGGLLPRHRAPLEMAFRIDLHRVSDQVLMASALVRKVLVVPAHRKAVLSEAERLLARLARAPQA
jgi:probable biosynthetic protein (TIGR04098 family)